MRWKSLGVVAVVIVLGAGCASAPRLGLPAPVSPPYSGFTQSGVVGADLHETVQLVYGCSTGGSTIWASVDPWPSGAPGTQTDDVFVDVYSGYHAGLTDLPVGGEMGEADLFHGQPASNVFVNGGGDTLEISAGQCFTVVVAAVNTSTSLAADIVHFTLNW